MKLIATMPDGCKRCGYQFDYDKDVWYTDFEPVITNKYGMFVVCPKCERIVRVDSRMEIDREAGQ